jgi:FixJ family two-component response regulator
MSCLQDRNLVLVVDDDPGMLRGIKRLLRQFAYDALLFPSAEAFKNHSDFETAACVILDINLKDGSGIESRHRLKAVNQCRSSTTPRANPAVRGMIDPGTLF